MFLLKGTNFQGVYSVCLGTVTVGFNLTDNSVCSRHLGRVKFAKLLFFFCFLPSSFSLCIHTFKIVRIKLRKPCWDICSAALNPLKPWWYVLVPPKHGLGLIRFLDQWFWQKCIETIYVITAVTARAFCWEAPCAAVGKFAPSDGVFGLQPLWLRDCPITLVWVFLPGQVWNYWFALEDAWGVDRHIPQLAQVCITQRWHLLSVPTGLFLTHTVRCSFLEMPHNRL